MPEAVICRSTQQLHNRICRIRYEFVMEFRKDLPTKVQMMCSVLLLIFFENFSAHMSPKSSTSRHLFVSANLCIFELRTIILCIITEDHHSPHHQQPQTEAHIITRATHFRYLLFADGATIDDGAPQWVQRAGPTSTGQRTK